MTEVEPHQFAQKAIREALIGTLKDNVSLIKVKGKDVPSIVDEDFTTQPNYPFVTLNIIDDFIPASLYKAASFFKIEMQIKAVSNDKWATKGLTRKIQQALAMPEVYDYLANRGISIQTESSIPFVADAFETFKQYTSGLDVVWMINDIHTISQFKQFPKITYERKD